MSARGIPTNVTGGPGSGETASAVVPALAIDNLSSGYSGTSVLHGVSLTVPPSSATALLGANGAGKTTLLRTAAGLLKPSAGRIELGGADVTRSAPHKRSRLGLCYIPEGRGVFRSLTVRENLVIQAARSKEADAIDRAVSAFPVLGRRLAQRAGTLSGGEQQMLAMAQAWIGSPKVILVDEASLGLAPVLVDEIFAFLERLSREGAALLLVDQFAARAMQLASWVYVLRRGIIVFEGTSKDLSGRDLFGLYVGNDGDSDASASRAVTDWVAP